MKNLRHLASRVQAIPLLLPIILMLKPFHITTFLRFVLKVAHLKNIKIIPRTGKTYHLPILSLLNKVCSPFKNFLSNMILKIPIPWIQVFPTKISQNRNIYQIKAINCFPNLNLAPYSAIVSNLIVKRSTVNVSTKICLVRNIVNVTGVKIVKVFMKKC